MQFFTEADILLRHRLFSISQLIGLLGLNQPVHAIQRYPAVVADDAAAPISIGQPGNNARFSGRAHFGRIDMKYRIIMRRLIFKIV